MRAAAPIWRSYAELQLGQTETAWKTLSAFRNEEPSWAYPWLCVYRGYVLDVMGKREEAIAQYQRTLALESPRADPEAIAEAEAAIKKPYRVETPPAINGVNGEPISDRVE
jgi:tetratricopeptide (TPR) repeat protein